MMKHFDTDTAIEKGTNVAMATVPAASLGKSAVYKSSLLKFCRSQFQVYPAPSREEQPT